MYSRSQRTTKCSVTLLQKGVSEIWRRSSSDSGLVVFPMGVTYSNFHCWGHSAVFTMLFIIISRGEASSTENSLTKLLGSSPGTPDYGFLAALIFSQTSNSLKVGGLEVSVFSLFSTLSDSKSMFRGGKLLLIPAK